jgi:hypothetical protein
MVGSSLVTVGPSNVGSLEMVGRSVAMVGLSDVGPKVTDVGLKVSKVGAKDMLGAFEAGRGRKNVGR